MTQPLPHAFGWLGCFDRVFCINLDRRRDRWLRSSQQHRELGLPVERVAAVDGQALVTADLSADEILPCFETTHNARWDLNVSPGQVKQLSAGEVGCAYSHLGIWKRVVHEGIARALVLEDDIEFRDDIAASLPVYYAQLPAEWDLFFLGYVDPGAPSTRISENLTKLSFQFGTFAYLVSERGARRLLERLPIQGPIDNFMGTQLASLDAFNAFPPLVRPVGGWNTDSDIVHSAQR